MAPTIEQVAWAAGLFEGEGCISQTTHRKPRLFISMTDKDVINKFIDIVEAGNMCVRNRTHENPNFKIQWQWQIQKASEVNRILRMFLPHLGERRAFKALNALDALDKI